MKRRISLFLLFSLVLSLLLLTGCAGSEERAWNSGQKALAEEKYAEAAAAFEKAGSFQDAEQLMLYAKASQNLENEEYGEAVSAFRALGDFKDSLLMDSYCQAREQEALAIGAFSSEDSDLAVRSCGEAAELYAGLSLFRDSDVRAAECRELLYAKATEWMDLGRYEDAASGFAALGAWQDSAVLQQYCKAASLETQGSYLEAADLYAEIPDVLDSRARADAVLEKAYDTAVELREQGDFEAASDTFSALGSYRDAKEQLDRTSVLLIRTSLQDGSYAEALQKLNQLSDLSVFPAADVTAGSSTELFLNGFLNTWMNAHAGVMTSFFSLSLLQPYLEPDGELDNLVHAELSDDSSPQHYGFIYYGAEIPELLTLDEGFSAARAHGSASYIGPDGLVEMDENMWILIDNRSGNPIVSAVLPC